MTDTDFEELKRVCRIRGVPEPTEATAADFCEAQRLEGVEQMKRLAERLRRAGPFVPASEEIDGEIVLVTRRAMPGPGFEIPAQFLVDGRIDPSLMAVE